MRIAVFIEQSAFFPNEVIYNKKISISQKMSIQTVQNFQHYALTNVIMYKTNMKKCISL